MNYDLLPPRPTLGDALKILKLSNTKEGKRQIYQHIVYDGLPAYTTLQGELVIVSDENIEHINDGLNPNSFSHVSTEERICRANVLGSDKNEKGSRLIAESYLIGGDECFKIVPGTKVADDNPMVRYGISQRELMLKKVEQKPAFWEIDKRTLDENHIHFKRDELRLFVKQVSELGFVEAEKEKLSDSLKKDSGQESTKQSEPSKRAALKVVGLLMKHLAKTPKYASGGNPNLSNIRKLLIDLAGEFNIKTYGVNNADELILKSALLYLKEEENDKKKD